MSVRHVGADVGEMPHLGVPCPDGDPGIDLAGDGEDPARFGMLLASALAGNGDSVDVRDLA